MAGMTRRAIGIHHEFHESHRVIVFFRGLLVKVRGQLRQRLDIEVRGNRHVLQRGPQIRCRFVD